MQTTNSHNINHIVFLGENGFPKGLAAIQRMTLLAKSLLIYGCKVTVVCRKGIWKKNEHEETKAEGNFEGIDYMYTSKTVFKDKGFINRNSKKIIGVFKEYNYLKKLKKQEKLELAIVSNMSAFHLLRYLVFSALLNFPIVLNFVEMASSMQDRKSFSLRINDFLIDRWIIKYFDAALPISTKLFDYYKRVAPAKPSMILPIICDFEKFNKIPNKQEPYFLYCGSMAYKEVVDFVLESYNQLKPKKGAKLYMIISGGTSEEQELFQQQLNERFENNSARLFSNIPYAQLVELYLNAKALLIPLRPTLQDASRFPHKIGEYLASGNPIITTQVGEIKNYFKDGENALIASSYSVDAFAKKMHYVLEHEEKASSIGLEGKTLGLKEFDYKVQGERLKSFLQEVITKK